MQIFDKVNKAHPDELLRLNDVLQQFPISRSSWYAGIKAGIYPQPIRISQRRIAWTQSAITELIAARISGVKS